ncbi:MAG: hypothetical protein JWL79_3531 [Frankiales bacterium]|jgi:hypothetical protein|nr:hypothetical protein [Frankiales bacterium]
MATERTGQGRLVRVVDWLGGGPRAVANAAAAVQRDSVAAHQRQQAWIAATAARPAPDGGQQRSPERPS